MWEATFRSGTRRVNSLSRGGETTSRTWAGRQGPEVGIINSWNRAQGGKKWTILQRVLPKINRLPATRGGLKKKKKRGRARMAKATRNRHNKKRKTGVPSLPLLHMGGWIDIHRGRTRKKCGGEGSIQNGFVCVLPSPRFTSLKANNANMVEKLHC